MKFIHVSSVALFLAAASGCGSTDVAQTSDPATAVDETLSNGGTHRDKGSKIVQIVEREDIVSNVEGAEAVDQDLRNAWGLAFSSRGTAWVSAAETGLSPVYDAEGNHVIPSVTIPTPQGGTGPSHPTGQVFNTDTRTFRGDAFIFVTEDGTISGWQSGTSAVLRADNSASKAIYKGVTLATTSSGDSRLYVTNFRAATVEVYDASYARIDMRGKFLDRQLPDGYAPFNVEAINGLLYVTYAKQDEAKEDDVRGAGNGFVDVFDPDGNLVSRLISRGALNAPWGLALAPRGFGQLEGKLLVGNFGDGMINVYDLDFSRSRLRADHEGVLGDDRGRALVVDGLWALKFGVDLNGFSSTDLYFTAGPNDEEDGVFGEIVAEDSHRRHGKKHMKKH